MKSKSLFLVVCCLLITTFSTIVISAQQNQAPQRPQQPRPYSLQGLRAVFVSILPISSQTKLKDLSEKRLQSKIEGQLREAGIRVLNAQEWLATPGRPRLQVEIGISQFARCGLIHSVEMKVIQEVVLVSEPNTRIDAMTWESGSTTGQSYTNGKSDPGVGIESALERKIMSFIDSYKAESRNR